MGTLFLVWTQRPGARRGLLVTQRREVSRLVLHCQDELPRVGRSQEQAIWPRVALRSPSKDYVLGALFLHHGQAKEGGARVEGATQMRPHRFPSTSGRGPLVEPSGGAVARPQEKWLSPLPPPHGSPVIGKGKGVFYV